MATEADSGPVEMRVADVRRRKAGKASLHVMLLEDMDGFETWSSICLQALFGDTENPG